MIPAEVQSFDYNVEYGATTPPGPYHGMSLRYEDGAVWLRFEGAVPRRFKGEAGADMGRELAELLAVLDPHGWPGAVNEHVFRRAAPEKRRQFCVWQLRLRSGKPEDGAEDLRLFGLDDGANAQRLAFEQPLADFFLSRLADLEAAAPRHPVNLFYRRMLQGRELLYSLSAELGKVHLSRVRNRSGESAWVHPAVSARLEELVRKYGVAERHGHVEPGWERDAEGAFELALHYDTERMVWVRGAVGNTAAGFIGLDADLRASLDAALEPGDHNDFRDLPRARLLLHFVFAERGVSPDERRGYELYWRRDPEGAWPRLRRIVGENVERECRLGPDELDELDRLLRAEGADAWHGFRGLARHVPEGTHFVFEAGYADHRALRAGGYMRFPPGYAAARKRIWNHLDRLLADPDADGSGGD